MFIEKIEANFTQQFETIEKTINTKMESQETSVKQYNEVLKQNIDANSETNVAISSISRNVENLNIKMNQEKEKKEKIEKEMNVCIFNVPESTAKNQKQARIDDVKKLHSILDSEIVLFDDKK